MMLFIVLHKWLWSNSLTETEGKDNMEAETVMTIGDLLYYENP